MNDKQKGVWQMSLSMLISGTIGAFVLLSGLPVIDVVFWRCVFGALALFVFIRFGATPLRKMSWRTAGLAILGGVVLVINWLLLFGAIGRASIGLATVVYNTQPFMLVLMSTLLGERVGLIKWGWLALAFAGVTMLLLGDGVQLHGGEWLLGLAMALGAAFFYALTTLITRQLTTLPPQHIAFVQVLTGIVMLLPLTHAPTFTAPFPWAILVTLGVVHTGMMYQLLYSAFQKLPTPIIGSLSFIYPLVAILVDNLLFGQTLSVNQLAGGALILFAAAGNNLGWAEWLLRRGQRRTA